MMKKGTIEIPLDLARKWYNKECDIMDILQNKLKELALQAYDITDLVEDLTYLPKNIEEARERLHSDNDNKAYDALIKLHKLRDIYRSGWKPDYRQQAHSPKYSIICVESKIRKDFTLAKQCFLSFPTEARRDFFYQNFLDLIEEAKEFI